MFCSLCLQHFQGEVQQHLYDLQKPFNQRHMLKILNSGQQLLQCTADITIDINKTNEIRCTFHIEHAKRISMLLFDNEKPGWWKYHI